MMLQNYELVKDLIYILQNNILQMQKQVCHSTY